VASQLIRIGDERCPHSDLSDLENRARVREAAVYVADAGAEALVAALEALEGFLDRVGAAQALRPGHRAEAPPALGHRVAAVDAVALDAHADVAEHPEGGDVVGGVYGADALDAELEGLDAAALRERLMALDPDPGVDLQNPVRMIRAIEILVAAGPPLRRMRTRTPPPWLPVRVGLAADLAAIDARLDERSRRQVKRGLVAETQAAIDSGVPPTAVTVETSLRPLPGRPLSGPVAVVPAPRAAPGRRFRPRGRARAESGP